MRKSLFHAAAALVLLGGGAAGSAVSAQDFQRTYRVGAGGSINIRNVSGDIIVTGYDGDSVAVRAFKEGRDRDQVEVEDTSAGNRVQLRARYPSCDNCSINASVRFEVQVPRVAGLRVGDLTTASGNIEVTGVNGEVSVKTASGDVLVKDVTGKVNASTASGQMRVREVAGSVSASTASGDVEVEISRLEGAEDMRFSSASGDVSVKLPANLDADVEMSSASGSLRTDFPIEIRKQRYGPGETARGRLGSGARLLRISSASGDVSLTN